jgi:hypothetical protein
MMPGSRELIDMIAFAHWYYKIIIKTSSTEAALIHISGFDSPTA